MNSKEKDNYFTCPKCGLNINRLLAESCAVCKTKGLKDEFRKKRSNWKAYSKGRALPKKDKKGKK